MNLDKGRIQIEQEITELFAKASPAEKERLFENLVFQANTDTLVAMYKAEAHV